MNPCAYFVTLGLSSFLGLLFPGAGLAGWLVFLPDLKFKTVFVPGIYVPIWPQCAYTGVAMTQSDTVQVRCSFRGTLFDATPINAERNGPIFCSNSCAFDWDDGEASTDDCPAEDF